MKINKLALAAAALALLGSCEKSRVDAMAASNDERTSRCIDAIADGSDPAWIAPSLGDTTAQKSRDGFEITCPFTLRDGRQIAVKVIVACPADTAVPCISFKATAP